MGEPQADQPLERRSGDGGDAVGGGGGRRRPRRAAGGRAVDDLHGVAGAPADDPQHVQDRGRADAVRDARGGAHPRDPRPVDFRRPLRCHGLPSDRLRAALLELRPGSARHGHRGPCGDARGQDPLSALLRRIPHLARGGEDRGAQRRRSPLAHLGIAGLRAPPARADAGPAGPARHGAEPRRLLSGARSAERVLRRVSRDRREDHAVLRRADRPPLQPVRVRRGSSRRPRDRDHGIGRRHRARNRRLHDGSRRQGGRAEGQALSPLRPAGVPRRVAEDRPHARDPGSNEGAGRAGRPALSRRHDGAGRSGRGGRLAVRRAAASGRRPLWPVVERVHARDDQRHLRQHRAGQTQAPLHRRHRRRRDAPVAAVGPVFQDRVRRCVGVAVLRARRGRHGRGQQELDQDCRPGNRAVRAGILRLRLEEIRGDHRLASAHEQEADPIRVPGQSRRLRRLSSVRVHRQDRRPRTCGAGRRLSAERAVPRG